jgi:hypothetical protein
MQDLIIQFAIIDKRSGERAYNNVAKKGLLHVFQIESIQNNHENA